MSADIRAGRAFIELAIKNKLSAGLKKAGGAMMAFGGLVAGPLVGMAKLFGSTGDNLHKMSIRTGIGAQALSELGYAAELSGTDLQQVGDAVTRMRRRIANAAEETGPAVRALKELNLVAKDITKLPVEEQFNVIVAALSKMENQSLANQMAFEVFGDSSKALLALLQAGTDGIEKMREKARKLGITMSDEDAQAAADMTDSFTNLWTMIKGLGLTIGAKLAPTLTTLSERIQQVLTPVMEFIRGNRELFVTAFKVAAAIASVGAVLVAAGVSLGVMGAAVSAIMGFLGAILSPISLVIAAVAALGYAILFHTDAGAAAIEWLRDTFGTLLDFVRPVLKGIKDALSAGDWKLAAKIAWLGIKLAFLDGTKTVRAKWFEFTTGLFQLFDDAMQKILALFHRSSTTIAEWLLKIGDKVGLLGDVSLEDATKALREDATRKQRTRDTAAEAREAARGEALQRFADKDKRRLDKLRAELGQATTEARVAATEAEMRKAKEIDKAAAPEMPDVGALALEGITSQGTFSAAAIGRMGKASGAQERTAKATEAALMELRRIREAEEAAAAGDIFE